MPDPEHADDNAPNHKPLRPSELYNLEALKQRYGLYKVIFGTAVAGILAVTLPFVIDMIKLDQGADLSSRDFVSKYIDMLERDPDAQIALVEYFAHVLPERGQRDLWIDYAKHLANKQQALDEKQRQLETTTKEDNERSRRLEDEIKRLQQQLRPIVPTAAAPSCLKSHTFDDLSAEYEYLYRSMLINPSQAEGVRAVAGRLVGNKARYEAVASVTGVPWYMLGLLHYLETGSSFTVHLHNGDPLTARTVHVPTGRPVEGAPPFTWEQSATDMLKDNKLTDLTDWSLARTLFRLEATNGFGYRQKDICTPYLWAGSNYYVAGGYVGDFKFDPNVVKKQIGAAVILKELENRGEIKF